MKLPIESKECLLPETTYVHDIENRAFQNIVARTISQIKDVELVEGGFIDNILGRSGEATSAIRTEQQSDQHSIKVRVEVNVAYGVSIPEKAEEIQSKVAESLARFTRLHVACVHVVFKDIISNKAKQRSSARLLEHQNDESDN